MSPAQENQNKRVLYGRRLGRPLRKTQRQRLSDFLPQIEVGPLERLAAPRDLFDGPVEAVWLEIGFGSGEHLAEQARNNPAVGLIGCEPFINGVASLVRTVEAEAIANVRIHADDARAVLDALPDSSVERCFILFPDPWPKRRHHGRRIVSPETLRQLARILTDGGVLRLASDHSEYVRWMLFHTLADGCFAWRAKGPADWRERPPDWPTTRYEQKAAQRGESSVFLEFLRRPRADK